MSTLPKYDSYKDSGIPWIGEIPEHWEVQKSKFLWKELEDRSLTGTEILLSVSQYKGVTPKGENSSRSESLMDYKKCIPNDLVINIMLAWLGGLGISRYKGIVSPAYCIYRQKKNNDSTYLGYLYKTKLYLDEFTRRSKGVVPSRWRMYTEDFGQVMTILPPLSEQTRIATFLDRKTAEIDDAIAKKERLIGLLKEEKSIIINQAVTKGLNPNAPMKDSGIKWIGKIPKHWEVKKIKHATNIFRGKFTHRPRNDQRLYDGQYPFIQTGDVAKAGKFIKKYRQTLNEKGLRVSTLIPKGTVVITIAANIGDISILGFDACFPDSVVGFKPRKQIERDFLFYILSTMKNQFMSASIQNTQMNLNVDRIGSNSVVLPPMNEQNNIIAHIEQKSAEIANLIEKTEQEIEKLKELKSVLISEAVTGKIKV